MTDVEKLAKVIEELRGDDILSLTEPGEYGLSVKIKVARFHALVADWRRRGEALEEVCTVLIHGSDAFDICGASTADHFQHLCACPDLESLGKGILTKAGITLPASNSVAK